MSNIALILVGIEDSFLSPKSTKNVKDRDELINNLQQAMNLKRYKAVINVRNNRSTTDNVSLLDGVPKTQLITYTMHSDSFNDPLNELKLNTIDGEQVLLDGNQLDFVLPPKDYTIHLAGIDVNGIFKDIVELFLGLGYKVAIYSDASRPLQTTYKYINGLPRSSFKHGSYSYV